MSLYIDMMLFTIVIDGKFSSADCGRLYCEINTRTKKRKIIWLFYNSCFFDPLQVVWTCVVIIRCFVSSRLCNDNGMNSTFTSHTNHAAIFTFLTACATAFTTTWPETSTVSVGFSAAISQAFRAILTNVAATTTTNDVDITATAVIMFFYTAAALGTMFSAVIATMWTMLPAIPTVTSPTVSYIALTTNPATFTHFPRTVW